MASPAACAGPPVPPPMGKEEGQSGARGGPEDKVCSDAAYLRAAGIAVAATSTSCPQAACGVCGLSCRNWL